MKACLLNTPLEKRHEWVEAIRNHRMLTHMKGVVNTKKSSQDPRATKREMVSPRLSIYLTAMQLYDQYLTLNWSKYLNTLVQ